MKNLLLIIVLTVVLVACSTEGDLKITNQTEHNVYFNIDNDDYLVDSMGTKTISLDTGDEFLMFGNGEKKYKLEIEGETFALPNEVTETNITLKKGETYKAYCSPTHAGVKIINNSGMDIIGLFYYTSNDETLRTLTDSIENGEEFWSRLAFATPENDFYYTFKVRYEDYTEEFFGGPDETTLGLDEQYVKELSIPTEGDLKIINQTEHNVYFNIDNDDYLVNSMGTKTISLDAGVNQKEYDLEIEGETFALPNGETETQITIENGETYNINCTPTHAGVKVINNSGQDIIGLFYYTSNDETLRTLTDSIENGEEFWSRLAFATPENDFYYTFKVRYEDYTEEFFGGPDETTLGLDEQYLIEINEQ